MRLGEGGVEVVEEKDVFGWMVGWLFGWLFGWLVGWLVGWLGQKDCKTILTNDEDGDGESFECFERKQRRQNKQLAPY